MNSHIKNTLRLMSLTTALVALCFFAVQSDSSNIQQQTTKILTDCGSWGINTTSGGSINALTATANNQIWAIGSGAWQSNDKSWQAYRIPSSWKLKDVTTDAAGNIWVVGSTQPLFGSPRMLLAKWDGRSWQEVDISSSEHPDSELVSISMTLNEGWAVGSYRNVSGRRHPLAAHWSDGAWRTATIGNFTGVSTAMLNEVLTFSNGQAVAVGYYDSGDMHGTPLAMRWDRNSWTIERTIDIPALKFKYLETVHGTSPDDLWAAGENIIVHWDGKQWSEMRIGSGSHEYDLSSVFEVGAKDVWAAGTLRYDPVAVILHWDGTAWREVSAPQPMATTWINDLTFDKDGNMWVVGDSVNNPDDLRSGFVASFNGTPCP